MIEDVSIMTFDSVTLEAYDINPSVGVGAATADALTELLSKIDGCIIESITVSFLLILLDTFSSTLYFFSFSPFIVESFFLSFSGLSGFSVFGFSVVVVFCVLGIGFSVVDVVVGFPVVVVGGVVNFSVVVVCFSVIVVGFSVVVVDGSVVGFAVVVCSVVVVFSVVVEVVVGSVVELVLVVSVLVVNLISSFSNTSAVVASGMLISVIS